MTDTPIPVREAILKILAGKSPRYSELVRELGRPDKTVFVNLRDLRGKGLVTKKDDRYSITEMGRRELRRRSLRRFVDILAELDVDLSRKIAVWWDEECLSPRWDDVKVPQYEGRFPDGCRVLRDFGTKWKWRLVEWKGRLWSFDAEGFEPLEPGEAQSWTGTPFKDSVSERTAELCVEANSLMSVT
jgi:DNA-binding transcriptional ArsR family regulator